MKLYELYDWVDYLDNEDNVEKKELLIKECKRVSDILGEFSDKFKDKVIFKFFFDPDGETTVNCYTVDEKEKGEGYEHFPKHLLLIDDDDLRKSCEQMYDASLDRFDFFC